MFPHSTERRRPEVWLASATSAVCYATHLGTTPGLPRAATGTTLALRAERSRRTGGRRHRKCSNCNMLREKPKRVCQGRHFRQLLDQPGRQTALHPGYRRRRNSFLFLLACRADLSRRSLTKAEARRQACNIRPPSLSASPRAILAGWLAEP